MDTRNLLSLTIFLCIAGVVTYFGLIQPVIRLIWPSKDRRVETVESLVKLFIFGVILLFFGFVFAIQFPVVLLFGWTAGFFRIVGGFTTEPLALLVGLSAALFFLFLHLSIRRFSSAWGFRRTLAVGAIGFGVAISGMALVCAVHEVWWLATKKMAWIDGFSSREASSRMKSVNNLKQIALGVHWYYDQYHALPNGGAVRADGSLGPSWVTLILPFMEQEKLYDTIRMEESWRSEANRSAYSQELGSTFADPSLRYKLPSHDADGYALCDYAANERVLAAGAVMTFDDITDGTSNTLLFGEVKENRRPWGDPVNARDPALGINRYPLGFGSYHPGGADFALCDGSARFISESIDPKILEALATPNGGEDVRGENGEWEREN